jgi:hypothetical protein
MENIRSSDEALRRFGFPLILLWHFWLNPTLTLSLRERGFLRVPPPSRGRLEGGWGYLSELN